MEDIPGVKWWTRGTVRDPPPARLAANTNSERSSSEFLKLEGAY